MFKNNCKALQIHKNTTEHTQFSILWRPLRGNFYIATLRTERAGKNENFLTFAPPPPPLHPKNGTTPLTSLVKN